MTTEPGPPVRPRRTLRRAFRSLAALLLATVAACGDDGTGPSEAELTGTWQATSAEVVTTAAPTVTVDVLAQGGSFRLTLTDTGSFTIQMSLPGEAPETFTGSWTASVDVLGLAFASGMTGRWEFDMTLSGDVLTLRGADAEYDVDGDDDDDPVKLNLVLARI